MGLSLGYQTFYEPHMQSFLLWAVVFYIVLLIVETLFGALAIRRFCASPARSDGVSA